ncbi:MAG: IS630 family transposase [Planctomycetota bacterium]
MAAWIEKDWPRIKRLARRRKAHLVFIDETGFLLAPLVRRTWGLRGQTPIMRQRTRHHRRVSAIGGLSISPKRHRLGWYLHFHLDRSIRQEQVIDFLRDLLAHLNGPIIVVWDRLAAHRSRMLRLWLRRCRRLHLEYLPGYAPELNPNEYGWAYLKGNPLANYCPNDVEQLHARVVLTTRKVASQQSLLRSFVHATDLPIRFSL